MPEKNLSSPSRVVGYVDGYNVYYGLLTKGWKKFYWLDLRALFTTLLIPGDELVAVKYFTARGRGPQDSNRRQAIYLGALASSGGVDVISGRFAKRTRRHCSYCGNYLHCLQCGRSDRRNQEKMTDVALGVNLVADAYEGLYDKAFLMTGDSDLIPAVKYVVGRLEKQVVVTPPPGRRSDHLNKVASGVAYFSVGALGRSQLPEVVAGSEGQEYRRPAEWR